jgi:FtsP/CotA-like multicopper oxidase with cupredoxin domain
MEKMVTRRQFIIASATGLAVIYGISACTKSDSPSSTSESVKAEVIDPPAGEGFKDPPEMPNLSANAGVVKIALEAKSAKIKIKGVNVDLMTYNGYFPQQTIRIKRGDKLSVNFKNSLPLTTDKNILGYTKNITNIHTHGWHVSPSGKSDNVFLHITPGEEFLYEYDLSKHEAGTLNFLHSHGHGLITEQMWGGIAGCALVVADEVDGLSGFETHIMSLNDISLAGTSPAPHTLEDYMNGKEGNIVMVNGQINPVLPIRPGQVQRWRVVNASTARFYKLSLEKHTMYLIGTDGGLLDKPYPLSDILLTPGERVDLLIKADQGSGNYRFLSMPYDRGGNVSQTVTLMTASYSGNSAKDEIPASVNPNAKRLNMDTASLRKAQIAFSMGVNKGLINDKSFGDDPFVHTSKVGTFELWEIQNYSGMDHPFHQHVNPAQIISMKGGEKGYASLYSSIPAWKDTINVPKGGSVTMLVPVRDFPGKTVFHCHIIQHGDLGMMAVWNIVK